MTDALHDAAFMDALFDLLIPPDESRGLPGAGSLQLSAGVAAGVEGEPLLGPFVLAGAAAVREAALAAHPDGLAAMSREAATELLQSQLAAHPLLPMGLMRFLCPPYYAHPRVLAAIGEPPRPRFPEGFDVQPTDPELLAKLQTRRKRG
jgi:hypothetical protein